MKTDFSKTIEGKVTQFIKLENGSRASVTLTNYGARIVGITVPDMQGNLANIVLGYNTLNAYLNSTEPYYGATIGRYANRIADGTFTLDDKDYSLPKNDPPNHLHGGVDGFHGKVWDVKEMDRDRVVFGLISQNGEAGYPGELEAEVSYLFTNSNELIIKYEAVTDQSTVLNMTNHSYFNLSGAGNGSIGNHRVYINADKFTPVNDWMVPSGELKHVEGTPLDFRQQKRIADEWDSNYDQLKAVGGYDHNFVLNKSNSDTLQLAASVFDPKSGRTLEVETTEPCVQFYTANGLNGGDIGREGVAYDARSAFCLETQHFPDSPNQPSFPSVVLNPGEKFKSSTIYRFI